MLRSYIGYEFLTRFTIMAGRYPYHSGLERVVIWDGHPLGMSLNQTIIADELKRGGNATRCVGKWDLDMHKINGSTL